MIGAAILRVLEGVAAPRRTTLRVLHAKLAWAETAMMALLSFVAATAMIGALEMAAGTSLAAREAQNFSFAFQWMAEQSTADRRVMAAYLDNAQLFERVAAASVDATVLAPQEIMGSALSAALVFALISIFALGVTALRGARVTLQDAATATAWYFLASTPLVVAAAMLQLLLEPRALMGMPLAALIGLFTIWRLIMMFLALSALRQYAVAR